MRSCPAASQSGCGRNSTSCGVVPLCVRNRRGSARGSPSVPRLLGADARDVAAPAQSPHPANDLLEPSSLETTAPLLAETPIPVDGAEDPGSQTIDVSLAAIEAAPSLGARAPLSVSGRFRHRASIRHRASTARYVAGLTLTPSRARTTGGRHRNSVLSAWRSP